MDSRRRTAASDGAVPLLHGADLTVVVDVVSGRTPMAITSRVWVDPDAPVFSGHYPGCALLPGLYLLECVSSTVGVATGVRRPRPHRIERIRFLSPVRPDDEFAVEAELAREGDAVTCTATVSTNAGTAASFRVRYRASEVSW